MSQGAAFPARWIASNEELSTRIFILLGSGSASEASGSPFAAVLLHGGGSFFPLLEVAESPIGFANPPIGLPIGFADDPNPLAEDPGSC